MVKLFCAPLGKRGGSATVYSLLEFAFIREFGGAMPEIVRTPNGKPFFQKRPEIHFSLSHAKTHVFCVLSSHPVGADIESPRHISDRAVRFFCSTAELSFFTPLELWVLKESYVKLVDANLAAVRTLRFSLENGKIVPPDTTTNSKLYRICDCCAAVSSYNCDLPETCFITNID